MEILSRVQVVKHYLNQYLDLLSYADKFKKNSPKPSDFAQQFFTDEERETISKTLKGSTANQLTDKDVIDYLLKDWEKEQALCEAPNENYLDKIVYQLGLQGSYLSSKLISQWDEYDYSNFNQMKLKSGKAKYGYAVFEKAKLRTSQKLVPTRWFDTKYLAQVKKEELMADHGFLDDELVIYTDLRPL